ncbi:PREDICTED: uncharacterized protein LOC104709664 [Camelina sativa]|uniref:Uncharacterized protein LOC104709664 n=1 Tax=Camelina sativa TaxID=90675 RepID=A0ABM0TD47_CAMSA|nr:PREDICTED: uncharacterized protein LOC104709664 [Camelina sativa]
MDEFHMISSLSPKITGWRICVKVLRLHEIYLSSAKFVFALILVDSSGTRIEAIIPSDYAALYKKWIQEGEWKIFTTFEVCLNPEPIRSTTHPLGIKILPQTVMTNSLPLSNIPFNQYTPFAYIIEDTVNTDVLVG